MQNFFCLPLLYFMPMPIHELTESDLKAYQVKLSKPGLFSVSSLNELSAMYTRFELNEQNLTSMKYGLDRIHLENDYAEEKRRYQARLSDLKMQYKQVDNRITSVEQKLSRGIPEDMDLVEKLITEQEAIVEEQEKLNASETALAEHKSRIDIGYGKTREKIERSQISQATPLKSKFEEYTLKIVQADKRVKMRTNLCALAAIIGFPLLIEFVASKAGMPVIIFKTTAHSTLFHYLFVGLLLLTELFLAERIRNMVYAFFAIRYAQASSSELLELLSKNLAQRAALEKSSGMTIQQVLEATQQINNQQFNGTTY